MAKYLSGRVKRDPQSALSADRYKYLDLKEAEPDLGDPLVGPSSVGAKPVPVGLNYIIVSTGTTAGERYWIPNQQGVIPGSISVFEEGALVGGLSSTTQLNFLGNAITATPGSGINTTPPNVNITVRPPGDNGSVLFKELDDFATSSKLVFNSSVGILTISNGGFNVGSGGTILTVKQSGLIGIGTSNPVRLGSDYSTSELHIRGDLKLSGTVWDSNNFSGNALDLLIRDDDIKPGFTTSGLRWVGQKELRAGAGGTFRNVQYHNSAGLVDGAEFFAYDPNYGNVGIGSTLPKSTYRLDVLGDVNIAGLATITNLFVSGISTLGVTTTTDLTAKQLKVSGISTLGITTTTDLTAQSLVVSGVSTFQNNIIQTSGLVGIGTTNPLQKFQIGTANTLGVSTDGKVFVVTADAKVGIGTTNPTAKLDVRGDVLITGVSTFNSNIIQTSGLVGIGTTNPLQKFQIGTANTLGINSEGTVFVVTSNADVGIGTTNPKAKLHVQGDVLITGVSTVGLISGTSANFTGDVTAANFAGNAAINDLYVVGISTFIGKVNIQNDLGVTGLTTTKNLEVYESTKLKNLNATGIATIGTLGVLGLTTTSRLIVSGVATIGNIKLDQNTIFTTSSNLILDTTGGLVEIKDQLYVTDTSQSIDKDDGSIRTEGGIGVEKNLNVGEKLTVIGNVGIGTLDPLQKFQIGVANTLGHSTDGKVFVVTSNADVGIGTTNPTAKLDVRGDVYIKDDLTVDGGDVKSNTTSLNLFNTNVTTANVLGDGTAIVIGATTGITTIKNNLTVDGDIKVGGNDIQASTGVTAITLSGANVSIGGTLTVTGNDIKSSTATAITLSGTNVTAKGNLTVDGNTTLKGTTTLGDAAGDTVYFVGNVGSGITPSANNTHDLGSSGSYWRNIYGPLKGNADTATLVGVGTTTGNSLYYLTFVDSNNTSRTNEYLYTDDGISYNPSTDLLTVTNLKVSGISTLGVTTVTDLTAQSLFVSGVSTFQNNIIQTSGLVGIGTDNPLQKLQIGVANTLGHSTDGKVFVITEDAKVGIGTTNPTAKLDVRGDVYIKDDLTVDGGDVKSANASLNLFNTNVTTANILDAGNNIVLGATTGITTIRNNVSIGGTLTVTGNAINSSTATAITLDGANVTVAGDIKVGGNDIQSSGGTTAITLDSSNVTVKGNLTVDSNTTLKGNITLGDTAGDTVSFGATVSSHIIPSVNDKDLGSLTNPWRKIYGQGINVTSSDFTNINVTGIATIATLGVTGLTTTKNLVVFDTVGIGTDNPLQKLQIGVANTLGHSTDGKVFVITEDVKVGIGTTNPLEKLDVRGAITGVTSINASDNNTNITLTSNTLTEFAGDIKVGGNDIQASNGNTNITLTSNTLTAFAGDIKVGGNDIQASTGTTAITLDNANVTAKGNLTVDGNTTLGNAPGDIVSFGATVGTGITPSATNTHDLGSTDNKWKEVHATKFVGAIAGNADTATRVGVGITTGTTSYYLTFVDSNNDTRANEYLYSDDGISYNPSTNDLTISGIVTAAQLSTGLSGTGVNITTNTISGPALLTIDPSTVGDNTGAVRIKGDLYVDGTQFIVNSTTIELADFIVGIASTATTDELANGAGIKIGPDNTLTYDDTKKALKSSENFNLASGKKYMIDGVDIGTPTSFPTLTSIGILEQLQVTGISTFTNGPVLIGTGTSTGTADQRLQVTGGAYVSDKVGIGTTNPLEKLDVRGAITGVTSINASDNNTNITLTSGTLTAFAGDIKVGGNNIKASDGTTAITLDGANVTAKGNLTVDGNTTLGNAPGDTVSFGATVGTGITPSATNTHELGSENYQWKKVWAEAFSGSLAGNSNTATKLATQKNIAITGDLTWNVNFDGSVNVSSAGTLSDTGVTAGIYGSATQVGIVTVDAKGRITAASNIPIDFGFGNATVAQANKLTTPRQIDISGDVIGVGIGTTFDGTQNVTIPTELSTTGVTAGIYGSATQVGIVTVDAKGRITAASNIPISIGGASLSSIAEANQVLRKNSDNTAVVGSDGLTYDGNALNVGIGTTVSIGGDAGRNIELGVGATNIETYIDFYGSTHDDYSARITRQPGLDGNFIITNKGAGNINLATTVAFGGTVSSHIIPSVPGTYNLGSETLKWGTVYATAFSGPITGNVTGTASYADNAGISTNLKEGLTGNIPYQSSPNNTTFLVNGASGTVLQSNGVDLAPSWVNATGLTVSKADYATRAGLATDLEIAANNQLLYQVSGTDTQVLSAGSANQLLQSNGSGVAPSWVNATGLTVSNASQVSTGSTDSNDNHYLNFSRNLNVERAAATIFTDSGITYNPSTNLLTVGGNILPLTDNSHNLGSNERKWGTVFATTFNGNITGTVTGNASYADNAGISTNLKGGTTSQIPYQSAANTTAFSANLTFVSDNTLTVGGNILPLTGNSHNLGSTDKKWNEVHANKYLGNTVSGTTNLLFSGNLKVGNGTTENYIVFHGTTGDGSVGTPGDGTFDYTYIGERIYETGTERSELLLFKGNDGGPGLAAYGPDRIRLSAAEIRFDTHEQGTNANGTFSQVAGAGTNKVIILSSGNVGIGTTNPTSKLHVNGTIISSAGTLGSNGNGTRYISTETPSGGSDGDIWYQVIS